ncbi:hypothetical protein SAMN06297280_3195 [Arsukibacterium tuosuense]|uniref:Solute-binding protein family 3/N-terminal domain-containing protein n=2 Tax=Arsukibacterium tuosuense TaxID=1323745 RepID=A0A285JAK9_9GAMM|nr:hypothetical protein SAMN06297280_3195 [Arsukibacterium tuosuense]
MFCWLTLCCHLQLAAAVELTITVPGPRSQFDIAHDYHMRLLDIALTNSGVDISKVDIQQIPVISEGRAKIELKKGTLINLYWLGAEQSLAEDLIPIKVPTTRGLIGFRKFIIAKQQIADFSRIDSLQALRTKVACQGQHWADTLILSQAGLQVTTSVNYEALFKMVALGRCDYFPRGYHDVLLELEQRSLAYPQLMRFDDIMLHYPFAVFFYVSKSAPGLAEKLQQGMEMAGQQGQINELMRKHPLTKSIFPLQNGKPKLYLSIPNPTMTFHDINNPDYWITPADFGITNSENQ